jgi:hypothetical protein
VKNRADQRGLARAGECLSCGRHLIEHGAEGEYVSSDIGLFTPRRGSSTRQVELRQLALLREAGPAEDEAAPTLICREEREYIPDLLTEFVPARLNREDDLTIRQGIAQPR